MATDTTGGRAVVDIYGEIGFYDVDASAFVADLRRLDATEIDLHLNSPGGDVYDGIAMFNALVDHPAHITVKVEGLAASIASVIAQAGDRIIMAANAEMMIHDAWAITVGDADEHRKAADDLDRNSDNIASLYAARSGRGGRKSWRQLMQAETWFSAAEAVAAGLADEALKTPRRSGNDASAAWRDELVRCRFRGRAQAPAPQLPERRTDTPGADAARWLHPIAMATPEHSTDTTDGEWDAATHTGRLDSPMSVETCDAVYAWYDPDAADEDGMLPKDACKLPHHEVSTDGEAGAANLTAVRNALARLESSDIPEDDYGDVRAHLYAHLDDADESDEGDDGGAFENAVVALSGTDVLAAIGRRLDGAAVAADVVTAACDAAVATVAPSVSREAPDATYAPPAPVPPAVADAPPIGTAEQALAAVTSAAASVAPTSGTAPGPATYAPPAPEPAAPPTHVPIGTAELVLASVTAHAQIPPAEPAPEPDRPDPVEHIRLAYLKELLPR